MMQKRELVLFLALAAVAAGIWYFQLNPRGPALSAADGEIVPGDKLGVDNPQLHWWKIAAARKTTYDFSRRNIFSAAAESPVPQSRRKKGKPAPPPPQAVPQLPPTPPVRVVAPLPVKFFGYASAPSRGPQRAFFTDGEQVYVVGEGELLLGRFRIVQIEKTSLEYEEVATGLRGSAVLEEQPGS
jgi:hypothetical protein